MNDEIKNLRSIRTNDNLFVEKTLVVFDFFLRFIDVHALTSDRVIFFKSFFSKLNDDQANQKRLKKINIVLNQISRTRFFWLSFIEAKTTTAWKKVELLREKLIFKLRDLNCLYYAKQRLECTRVLDIACTAYNKKKWMRFDFLFALSSLLSAQTDQELNWFWRIENENLKSRICLFQVNNWRVRTKARTLNWRQENFESWTWNAWNSWNCYTCFFEHCCIIANDRWIIVFFFESKLQLFFRNFYE